MTSESSHIEVGNLDPNLFELISMKLDRGLLRPAELILTVRKKQMLLDSDDIRFTLASSLIGQRVKIAIETSRRNEELQPCGETLEFEGIVFGVQNIRQLMGHTVELTLIARSPDALLIDNPHCTSFESTTLDEIVKDCIGNYNDVINAKIDPFSDAKSPYVVQYNESTYGFLCRLALRYGEFFYYDNGSLVFGRIQDSEQVELSPITDIVGYQYDLELRHDNCLLSAHDYLNDAEVHPSSSVGLRKNGHNLNDAVIDSSDRIYRTTSLRHFISATSDGNTKPQLEEAAETGQLARHNAMLKCLLRTNRADIKIGDHIVIKEIDETKNSEAVRHDTLCVIGIVSTMTANGHFENEVTAMAAPSNDNDCRPPYGENDVFPHCESQHAVVADVDDPEGLGRVRVRFLWQELQNSNMLSPWLRIVQPHGGANKGFYFIPEVGEEVMVAFEGGNAEKPYVAGTLYNAGERPSDNWIDSDNTIKAIRTRNGHTIEIHDESDGGYIRIYDNQKENYILTFSTDEKLIKLESTGNIELYAQNDIIMHAGNDMNIEVGNNRTLDVGSDERISIGKNQSVTVNEDKNEDVGNDRTDTVGRKYTKSIGEDSDVEIGGDAKTIVANKHTLKADNILQVSEHKTQLYSDTSEQKADSSLKIDGGSSVDIHGENIRIS